MMDTRTIEQIDEELEEARKKAFDTDDTDTEEIDEDAIEDTDVEDENISDDVDEDVDEDDDDEELEEVEETDEDDNTPPPAVDKKEYAFKKLREEKEAFKSKAAAFEEMALNLGYKDGEALLQSYRDKKVEEEATSKGIDPTFYKEFTEVKNELAKTRSEKVEQERQIRVDKFLGALDEVAKDNSLDANEKQDIVNQLEADGYTLDDIVNIKAPKKLIRGYLTDKIAKSKVQKTLKATKDSLQEEKISSKVVKKADWKDEIRKELEDYAKENNLHFED